MLLLAAVSTFGASDCNRSGGGDGGSAFGHFGAFGHLAGLRRVKSGSQKAVSLTSLPRRLR